MASYKVIYHSLKVQLVVEMMMVVVVCVCVCELRAVIQEPRLTETQPSSKPDFQGHSGYQHPEGKSGVKERGKRLSYGRFFWDQPDITPIQVSLAEVMRNRV